MTQIERIAEEVREGKHDSSLGLRPYKVFVDQEGCIALLWCLWLQGIAWSTKIGFASEEDEQIGEIRI
jgi:hypothetical protein